jgi:flavin reductase (DIM6/NTAB) family NADH-FMN oxidoreductase RutF
MSKLHWKPGTMLYPVPPVMVTCGDMDAANIITVAWAGTVCTNPAMVSIAVRKERYSYPMIIGTGEFVINLTTQVLTHAADFCGVKSGRDLNKFKETGLTPLPAVHVKTPLIAESPVNIECKVHSVTPLGSHDLILANVLGVNVDEALLSASGKLELSRAGLVAYSHGAYYTLGNALGTFGFSVKKPAKKKRRSSQRPK